MGTADDEHEQRIAELERKVVFLEKAIEDARADQVTLAETFRDTLDEIRRTASGVEPKPPSLKLIRDEEE